MKPANLQPAIDSDHSRDTYGNLKFAEREMERRPGSDTWTAEDSYPKKIEFSADEEKAMREARRQSYRPDFDEEFGQVAPPPSGMTPNQRVNEAFAPDLGASASGQAVATPSDMTMARMTLGTPAQLLMRPDPRSLLAADTKTVDLPRAAPRFETPGTTADASHIEDRRR